MQQYILLSFALLGVGLYFPEIAYGNNSAASGDEQSMVERMYTTTSLDIEERIVSADGSISYDLAFGGSIGEIVVLEIKREDNRRRSSLGNVTLCSPSGEKVYLGYHPDYSGIDYFGQRYITFVLPETGEYRLEWERDNRPGYTAGPYILSIRAANYYEQLIITAKNYVDVEQYDEALSLLAIAVNHSPELPSAYISRLLASLEALVEMSSFEENVQALPHGDQNAFFDLAYKTFKTLDAEEQALVLSDLRRLEQIYSAVVASDEMEMRDEYELVLYSAVADFLETGILTEPVRYLIFSTVDQSQEVASF